MATVEAVAVVEAEAEVAGQLLLMWRLMSTSIKVAEAARPITITITTRARNGNIGMSKFGVL